jgi:ribosome-associated protein
MTRDDEGPSRGARKRESEARQELGERLVGLKQAELARIPLPEELASAIAVARGISERGGRRRQLQYIGKLMRRIETRGIEAALKELESDHRQEDEEFHHAEQWRDRLLKEGPAAIDALSTERPSADTTRIATLVTNAAAEKARHQPPRAARELFRYLRDVVFAE